MNCISTEKISQILCLNISDPDYTIIAHFVNVRDYDMSVYALQRAGFLVPNASSTDLASLSQTNTTSFLGGTPGAVTKRLSSLTTLTSQSHSQPLISSAPNPRPCQNEGPLPHLSQNPFLYRSESLPIHKHPSQSSGATFENIPRVTSNGVDEFNPYKVFAQQEKQPHYPVEIGRASCRERV